MNGCSCSHLLTNLKCIQSCAPLWQQNCGYAREANGICFELLVNGTQVKNVKSLKPPSQSMSYHSIAFVTGHLVYIRGLQPTARGPQSGPPGQSMWPSTMAGQKNFFLNRFI